MPSGGVRKGQGRRPNPHGYVQLMLRVAALPAELEIIQAVLNTRRRTEVLLQAAREVQKKKG